MGRAGISFQPAHNELSASRSSQKLEVPLQLLLLRKGLVVGCSGLRGMGSASCEDGMGDVQWGGNSGTAMVENVGGLAVWLLVEQKHGVLLLPCAHSPLWGQLGLQMLAGGSAGLGSGEGVQSKLKSK